MKSCIRRHCNLQFINGFVVPRGHLAFGAAGERVAVRYLRKHGYQIWCTNWKYYRGEIDIIARKGATLVFVEVKTRHGCISTFFDPFEAIDSSKMEQLEALMTQYERVYGSRIKRAGITSFRFDAISVVMAGGSWFPSWNVEHVEDAL